jgi:hypothetical protein
MNERIKSLMQQAGTDTSGKWLGVEHAEKFAELIVKECVKSLWTEECQISDLASEEYTRGSNKIKKHFGVEE